MNALLLAGFFCSYPALEPNELQKEFTRFEGVWHLVRIEGQGKALIPKEWPIPEEIKIWLTGMSSFFFTGARAGFHLDPTQSPRHLDMVIYQDLPIQKCIYAFDGDQLKIAMTFDLSLPGGEASNRRPKSFMIADDSSILVFVLKRVKP